MTIQEATLKLRSDLEHNYDPREASNIASMVLEHITSLSKGQRLTQKDTHLTADQLAIFQRITIDLLLNMPVQYVLGEAWFYGYRFQVNSSVLIPRPETEELVKWVLDDHSGTSVKSVLDIGTGSGCIAISLKLKLNSGVVSACDISLPALEIARKNATNLGADVRFFQADVLAEEREPSGIQAHEFTLQDIIVSNPPYIPATQQKDMLANVVHFEPANALFVPDHDPLLFYRSIARIAVMNLKPGGSVYVEIHEDLGEEVLTCFRQYSFDNLVLRKDMQGKNRMVRARKT